MFILKNNLEAHINALIEHLTFQNCQKGYPKASKMTFLAKKQVFWLKSLVKNKLTASEEYFWPWNDPHKVLFMIQGLLPHFNKKYDVGARKFDNRAKMGLWNAFRHPFLQFLSGNLLLRHLYELLKCFEV